MEKNLLMTLSKNLHNKYLALSVFLFLLTDNVFAAGEGGLKQLESQAKSWDAAIYAFIGVCAAIYLVFVGVNVWLNRKTWGDFGEAALKVAVVGGVPALAVFAWNFFGK